MKLIKFLNEAKALGILYHFTNFDDIFDIVEGNYLFTKEWSGISLTRNFYLRDFGFVRIAIDGDKLSNFYKIKPYIHGGSPDEPESYSPDASFYKLKKDYGDEREERVYPKSEYGKDETGAKIELEGKAIKNLDKFIVRIDTKDMPRKDYMDLLKLKDKKGFKYPIFNHSSNEWFWTNLNKPNVNFNIK